MLNKLSERLSATSHVVFEIIANANPCLTVLLAIHTTLHAQQDHIRFEHLSVEQGLSHNIVFCSLQDRKGFMWFGTTNGLNKYDGYGFTVYQPDLRNPNSLSHKWVWAICEDKLGALWIGTKEGLNKFDPVTETFTRYQQEAQNPRSLSSDEVISLYEDKSGILWVGTTRGLNRFDRATQTFTRFRHDPHNPKSLFNDFIGPIYEDYAGTLWIGTGNIGTGGGGLDQFNRETQTFKHYRPDPAHPNSLSNWVTSIYQSPHARDSSLWVGTDRGLVRFDRATESFIRYPDLNNVSTIHVKSICADWAGALWIATWGRGLNRLDQVTGKFANYRRDPLNPRSLSNDLIWSIYADKSGTLWIATNGGGLNKFDPEFEPFVHSAQHVHDPSGLGMNEVLSIYESHSDGSTARNTLWVGTRSGLGKFDRATGMVTWYKNNENPSSLSNNVVLSIHADPASPELLWIGTNNGLNKLNKATGRFTRYYPRKSQSPMGFTIWAIHEDSVSRNTLWLGTLQGLDKFHPLTMTDTIYANDPQNPKSLSNNDVRAIFADPASPSMLWVGTVDGLNRFDRVTETFTRFKHDPQNSQSLSLSYILTISADKEGTLWIGTASGLNKLVLPPQRNSGQVLNPNSIGKGSDRATVTFTHFTEKDGLPSELITGILGDANGNLWLSTNKGLSKFSPESGRCKNYDATDGLQSNDFYPRACYQSKSGEMFFGGANGFIAFYPEAVKGNSYPPPPIVITAFKKFDQLVPLDSAITAKKQVELSYRENFFSFEFAALNYTHPGKNEYAYMLEGFDRDWIYCGTRRYASYTNLDGGRYIFRAKGSNNNGVWNEVGTAIAVIIKPPFWKTWWFMSLFCTTCVITIGGGIRYNEIRKLRERLRVLEEQQALERERLRISQDMHDEVGASLTAIAILSELARKDLAESKAAETHVQKISEQAREVIDNIGEIIWAINPRNDPLDNLAAYLRHYAVRYFMMTVIKYHCEFPETMPEVHLSAEVRRNIFLVFKEALHNIVKHAAATEVVLRLTCTAQRLEILIDDNGKGFSPENLSQFCNGLHNMKKRLENIGGTFSIQSRPNCGTQISVVVGLEL
ncbi:MAG: sensor histidine kinase [bacterium]